MISTERSKFRHFVFAITAMSAGETAIAECVSFPRQSADPVVEVCDENNIYSFRVAENTLTFEHSEFESKLSNAVTAWSAAHNLNPSDFTNSETQIWMTVPETSPEAAQPRAIVSTPNGNLSFWFDLWAGDWILNDAETAVLGSATYPDSFGYRPLKILAKGQPGASERDIMKALKSSGAVDVHEQGNGWYIASCELFKESHVATTALRRHSDVLKYAQINSVMEWIADRQMAFKFKLQK